MWDEIAFTTFIKKDRCTEFRDQKSENCSGNFACFCEKMGSTVLLLGEVTRTVDKGEK